jgi:hypothetical protein
MLRGGYLNLEPSNTSKWPPAGSGDFVNKRFALFPLCISPSSEKLSKALSRDSTEHENKVNCQKVTDNRVRACLYFIQPRATRKFPRHELPFEHTDRLRSIGPVDIELMSRLH